MAATLSKAQQKLLEDLGISSSDLERAQARKGREEKRSATDTVFDAHEEALEAFIKDVLEVAPISPSSKEGSTWVGSVVSGTVGSLSLKVTLTDTAAVEAAKAAAKAQANA